jgi:hypothetical protein
MRTIAQANPEREVPGARSKRTPRAAAQKLHARKPQG